MLLNPLTRRRVGFVFFYKLSDPPQRTEKQGEPDEKSYEHHIHYQTHNLIG